MTRRDSYILMVVAVLGAVGAFWFLGLAPKREKLSALDKDVAEARQTVDQASQDKVRFARDQIQFPRLYASLGRLGKAVPPDQDVPSLLVQLNHAAARANVNFHSVELKLSLATKIQEGMAASAAASASAGTTTPPAAGGQATPPASGESGATPPAAGAAPGATATAAAGSSAPAAGASAPAAGASADTTTLPATAGEFKVLPFEYVFKGDFFELEKMIHNVTRLVERRNQELAITGRLITIRGFAMKRKKITVLATSFMLPADQALFGGATPQGPGTTGAAPQAASTGVTTPAPPTAAVTSP